MTDLALIESTTNEVKALADAMRSAIDGARTNAIEAVAVGHRLGTLLEGCKVLEQGAFDLLLEAAKLNKDEASSLMRLSRTYTLDEVRLRSDAQRQMMFALGVVPEKEAVTHDGDEAVAVSPGLGSAVGHWRKFMRALETQRTTLDAAQAREQTRELFQWLWKLHGATPPPPQK